MKRLTDRSKEIPLPCADNALFWARVHDKLAAYEDAEEQGRMVILPEPTTDIDFMRIFNLVMADAEDRVIVLPCKVGDRVYRLWSCGKNGKSISEMVVNHVDIDFLPEIEFACRKEKATGNYWFFKLTDIGKTYYLTREEAEKALEGMG